MDFTGETTIPAPIQKVWEGINDPEILKQCIDGCEVLDKTSDTEFSGKVKVKVGPVSARFSGDVTLTDVEPPKGCTLNVKGSGGAAGFAKGSARVELTEEGPSATRLTYAAKAEVGGKLASVGARLVRGVADRTAADFFQKFSDIVGEGSAPEEVPATAAEEAAAPVQEPEVPPTPAAPPPAPAVAAAVTPEPPPIKPQVVSASKEEKTRIPLNGQTMTIVLTWGTVVGLAALVFLYSLMR